jgi:hypothetical protein
VEPSRLRVLDEGLVESGLDRIGAVDDRRHVVGDHGGEDPAEERPRRLEAADHGLGGLVEAQPEELVAGVAGGEQQRPDDAVATGPGVEQRAHAAEVDLEFVARLAVGDAHRRALALGSSARLGDVALHGAQRHVDPSTAEQIKDLHRREVVLDPGLDLVVAASEHPPGLAVAVCSVGSHGLDHLADELVAQLLLAAAPIQAEGDGRLDVSPHGLAVDLGQPLNGAQPLVGQPEPEHFSDLEHSNLPEHSAAFPIPLTGTRRGNRSAVPALVDPREVVP